MNEPTLKEQILKIKQENPTFGYTKIGKLLNCDRHLVRYHLNPRYRVRAHERLQNVRKETPLKHKVFSFTNKNALNNLRCRKKKFNAITNDRSKTAGDKFKIKDLLNKIGDNPKCYLTGKLIDLNNPSTYHLDHKIPVCKGGDNSLENCDIACKEANQAKAAMIPEEFFDLCKSVLEHNGYTVTKNEMVGLSVIPTETIL